MWMRRTGSLAWTAGTSTCRSTRSNRGPEILDWYSKAHRGARGQAKAGSSRWPQRQGRVAFLPFGPVILKHQRLKPYRDPPQTLGGHLKRRRLGLGLFQKDVARQLHVGEWTYLKWEHDRTFPNIRMWPRVFRFLGFYPFPVPRTLSDRLIAFRRLNGLSRKGLAGQLGVDEGTLAKWENGERGPAGNRIEIVKAFFRSYG